jgi:hypothetical protein
LAAKALKDFCKKITTILPVEEVNWVDVHLSVKFFRLS